MLCYAMLHYVTPCYTMLCYVMLCYAVLCYAVLCYARNGQVKEMCDGIRAYFNAMLGSQLLYKFERLQYAEVSSHQHASEPSLSAMQTKSSP